MKRTKANIHEILRRTIIISLINGGHSGVVGTRLSQGEGLMDGDTMERKDLRKKYIRNDDMFEAKVTRIRDPKLKQDTKYHVLTGKCPYNKKECSPVECRYGKDGMSHCPIHKGQNL